MSFLSRSGVLATATLVLVGALATGYALRTDADPETPNPRAALAAKFGAAPENVRDTPVSGIYEVSDGTEVLYVTEFIGLGLIFVGYRTVVGRPSYLESSQAMDAISPSA